jgi:hypothetical protein
MGFVKVISTVIGYTALTVVYCMVVTPMALLARLMGRDRLQLKARGRGTYWHDLDAGRAHNPERQF